MSKPINDTWLWGIFLSLLITLILGSYAFTEKKIDAIMEEIKDIQSYLRERRP